MSKLLDLKITQFRILVYYYYYTDGGNNYYIGTNNKIKTRKYFCLFSFKHLFWDYTDITLNEIILYHIIFYFIICVINTNISFRYLSGTNNLSFNLILLSWR